MSSCEVLSERPPSTGERGSGSRFDAGQRVVLLVLLGAGFTLSVDFSILNVALPEAGAGIGLGVDRFSWIATAYALPAAGFTLLFGRLGDIVGRRRVFLAGVALLAGASLLGGIAADVETLLAARVLQGLATAMSLPTALSLLTTSFADGPLRERALGMNGALLSGGFTVGALVGGVLVSALGWRAAFFVNVPVAVTIMVVAPLVVAESVRPQRSRLDVPGAVTVTGGLLALVYAVVERHLGAAAVGVVLLSAFVVVELRADAPLVPLRILRRPSVKWGNLAGFAVFSTEPAMIFLMTLYLQQVLHLTPLATGLVFGVPGLASVVSGVVAGRIVGRVGRRRVLVTAMAVQGLATVPLLAIGPDPAALAIVVPSLFVGFFGHVAAIVAFTVTATSGLPDGEQGLATGLTSMTQQIAITVGIPVLGAVAATQAGQLEGIRLALGAGVAVTLVTAVLVGFGLRPRLPVPGLDRTPAGLA